MNHSASESLVRPDVSQKYVERLELLSTKLTSNAIRVKFLDLAEKTGKLKAPDWSWGNIVSYQKEFIHELHKHKSVDKALLLLSKDQAEEILKHYYHMMGLEIHFTK